MRRRLLLTFLGLLACAIVLVATVPLWLGVALGWAGGSRGLRFARYERVGYGRFVIHEAEFQRGTVRVTAGRLELNSPAVWYWHRLSRTPNFVTVEKWTVDVQPSPTPAPAASAPRPSGWMPLEDLLQKVAAQLDCWLPQARLGSGVIRFPGGELALDAAQWEHRQLTFANLAFHRGRAAGGGTLGIPAVSGTIVFPGEGHALRVALQAAEGSVAIEGRGPDVSGKVIWWDQTATLAAQFADRGWLPREASLNAADWNVPGSRLKLGEFYSAVRGHAKIDWRDQQLVADIAATSEPVPNKKAVPPLNVTVQGHGSPQAFVIEAVRAELPGIAAHLSQPVTIERAGKIREGKATFAFQVDLAKQPWFAAQGTAAGEAELGAALAAATPIAFHLEAKDVKAQGVAVAQAGAKGTFTWPRIEIAEATLVGAAGDQLHGRGGFDIHTKEILPATVEGTIRRATLARWLPKQPEFEALTIKGTAAGKLSELQHAGRAEVAALTMAGLKPASLAVEWRGRAAVLDLLNGKATTGGTTLTLSGTIERDAARLSALEIVQGGESRLKLAAPAIVRWRTGAPAPDKPALTIESLRLAGTDASLVAALAWGEIGHIEVAAQNVSSSWLTDFIPPRGPAWKIGGFALQGTWSRGPAVYSLTAGATVDVGDGKNAAVNIAARGDKSGMFIEALRAVEGNATVLNAAGHLPLVLQPGATPLVQFDERGALAFDASTAPQAVFWRQLAELSGVELKEPQASIHLAGTWQRPEGELSVKAARVAVDQKRYPHPLPTIEGLDIHATADRGGVTLDHCTVSIEGQIVRANGRLPVAEARWPALFHEPLAVLERDADVHLDIPDAEIAVFARFLPAALAPLGRLQVNVSYKSGALAGDLRLRNAASRPLGPLGVLQEINAEVRMNGRTLTLEGVTAKAGGQPITLTGTIELPPMGGARQPNAPAPLPRFDLALRGENLPFVRQTGLLLRGDLDLKLQTPRDSSAPTSISGTVRLRDSLFLSDVRAFLPKGGASNPLRRPPYFAIDTPPLNAWTLAVELSGDRFLRLRMPVFNGTASAHFRLGGTLGEPRAIGDVTVEEGQVMMPFANFDVKQAAVRLTEADPFEPTIYLRGTTRRYGYDVAMEIDGRASAPNVVFTSSPALDSEQVLLMVMTGAVPTNDIASSGTQRMANIGWFLGQSLVGSLVGGNAANADRLSITSGEKISRQGKETYDIEYKLSDRWTAVGEYNEFDEYIAGLKWRVLPRKRGHAEPDGPAPKTEVASGDK